jgi:hypothetical protein
MSWRTELRAAAAAALAPLVPAGRVFQAPTWPLQPSAVPAILLNTSLEAKEALGKGAVEFTATTQLVVRLQLAAGSDAAAEAAVEALADAAENTLLTSEAFMAMLEQVAHVETEILATPQAKSYVAEAAITLACQSHWEPVVPPSVPLARITLEPPSGAEGPVIQVTIPQS